MCPTDEVFKPKVDGPHEPRGRHLFGCEIDAEDVLVQHPILAVPDVCIERRAGRAGPREQDVAATHANAVIHVTGPVVVRLVRIVQVLDADDRDAFRAPVAGFERAPRSPAAQISDARFGPLIARRVPPRLSASSAFCLLFSRSDGFHAANILSLVC